MKTICVEKPKYFWKKIIFIHFYSRFGDRNDKDNEDMDEDRLEDNVEAVHKSDVNKYAGEDADENWTDFESFLW